MGLACIQKGHYLRGIEELELADELTGGEGRVRADLAYAYAVSGNGNRAADILNGFIMRFHPEAFPAAMIAEVYIGLGDKDRAFEWLHKAIDQRDIMIFLKCDPMYDSLRSDQRFPALMKRMNLAPGGEPGCRSR